MKTEFRWMWGFVAATLLAFSPVGHAAESRIGAGANYWVALDDLSADEVDETGISYLASYQYRGDLAGIELDIEFLPGRFGEDALAPQAYVILGSGIYAAAGIGLMHANGEFADEPFYAFKAGLALELLPRLRLDLSANYRFNDRADLEDRERDIDTDTVFLGMALRLSL